MLGNVLLVLLLNVIIVAVFIQIAKIWQKTAFAALLYGIVIGMVTLMPRMLMLNIIGFAANFLLAFGVFALRRKLEGTWWTILVAILGGILMWYVAYLPVAFVQDAPLQM
jgi:hypothetical protein